MIYCHNFAMNKITNLISPLLKKYRYRKKADPFAQFKQLRKNEKIPLAEKGNVLILPIRVAPVSNLFEGIYGYALKLAGYRVHGLFCGQTLQKCENQTSIKENMFNCSLCFYEQKRFIDTFGISAHYYSDILNDEKLQSIREYINSKTTQSLLSLVYDDSLLGNQIQMAVIRYLLSSKIDLIKHKKIIHEFAYSTIVSYEATKILINILKPKFVLLSHGVYSTWGGAIEACKKEKIKTIVWGRGYVRGNVLADYNDSYIFECAKEPNEYWENIMLSDIQKKQIKEYFLAKKDFTRTADYVNYYEGKAHDMNTNMYSILQKNERVKFALFPNIPWDGTTFSSSQEFGSLDKFLEVTLKWFIEHPECDLIIRAHPAELADRYNLSQERVKDLINHILPVLPSNICYIGPDDDLTSYVVSDLCDINLFFASTMALELAFAGKTVIQTGQSMISNKGFVFEPQDIQAYTNLLVKAAKRELFMTDIMKERVEKYAYHWIYKRHFPENTYTHKALTFTQYNFNSSMELAPGNNKVVDWFIHKCENGLPFIWEDNA